ncbi:predicted protein [Naegleria gruberi]|uniref:Predicted protein n=1 Tax=Naegleria gruberi TaxID=5762 RepID=D2VIY9_NAEGR|nr:uncharacterized protein NAEGRDRAFT_68846 [Naegleria gruberi]EFC43107.1 predicted protein [Naegleria gruberi]|eukprot:XP_002675851.1 predicted protein [Naegleria gruberi strain NEG-M]
MQDNNLLFSGNNSSRKHASIKSQSEISYSQRKNNRIDLQKQAHKQKRNQLLEQLKRRKVSDTVNDDATQGSDYVYNIGVFCNVLLSQESSIPQKINAMKQSRIILSKCDPDTLTNILEKNDQFINLLHQYLTCKYSELQLESAWCITNIAAMKDESVSFCIPTLIQLISNSFLDVVLQEQCIWALGNISLGFYNNTPLSTVIIQNGAIQYLSNTIRTCRAKEILKTTLWCVSNIIRNEILHMKHNTPEHNQQIFGCLGQLYEPIIYQLLKRNLSDDGNISDLLYVLSYLTAYPLTDMSNSTNFVQIFIKYLTPQKQEFITPIIRIIGNIFCSYNLFSALDQNLSLELMNLLSNIPDKNKEWCYMMGNISSYEEINEILIQQYHLLNIVIDTLKIAINSDISNNSELVRETVYTIINLTTANHNKYLTKEILELIQRVAQTYTFDENENNQQFKMVLTQFFDYASRLQ